MINKGAKTTVLSKRWQYTLWVLTIALGFAYIWQVNAGATAGFTLNALEQEIEVKQMEQDRLDVTVARLQSIDSVSTRVQMLGLIEVEQVEYVTAGQGSVAINR